MTEIAAVFLLITAAYLCCGIVFTFFFLAKGLKVIDEEGSHGAPIGFKMIIIPGIIVFWSFLFLKWRKQLKDNHSIKNN